MFTPISDCYAALAKRRARKERLAKWACITLIVVGTVLFFVCLLTPQP